jgi:hypothetical protein
MTKLKDATKTLKYYLDKDLDTIFNLELVKDGARDAYLLEYNDTIEHSDLLKLIKQKYPELKHTTEHVVNDKPFRTFIHFKKLSPIRKGEDEDMWVGRMLGFECLGVPSKDIIGYGVHITVNDQSTYAEICSTELLANKSRKNKIKLFKKTADRLNLELSSYIKTIIPYKMYLNAILHDHKWLIEHKDDFFGHLWGCALNHINNTTIEELLENYYDWLLFTTLRNHFNPVAVFYPLGSDSKKLENIEIKIFKDVIKKRKIGQIISPIDGFKKLEKLFINDLLLKNENMETEYSKDKVLLFNTYEYLYNKCYIKNNKCANYWDVFIKYIITNIYNYITYFFIFCFFIIILNIIIKNN